MSVISQLPPALDVAFVAGNPFAIAVTSTGATITAPAVTMRTQGGDAYTTDPGIPTVSQLGAVTSISFTAADTAALNTGTGGAKFYRWSLQALVNGTGPYELVAKTIKVYPVGTAASSTSTSVTLDIIVGGAAVSLSVAVGAGMTAADILTAIKTVDGAGSGLDADLLDGISSAGYATAAQGLTVDGNISTRVAGVPGEITRANLAADTAFTSRYVPQVELATSGAATNIWQGDVRSAGNFLMRLEDTAVFGAGNVPDGVLKLGYNVSRQTAGEPSLHLSIESNYQVDGTGGFMECHFEGTRADGGTRRPFSFSMDRSTGAVDAGMYGERITFGYPGGAQWMQMTSTGVSHYLRFLAGSAQSGNLIEVRDAPSSALLAAISGLGVVTASALNNAGGILPILANGVQVAQFAGVGQLGLGMSAGNAMLNATVDTAARIGMQIKLAAAATASALVINDSTNTLVFGVDQVGDIILGPLANTYIRNNTGSVYFGTADDIRLYRSGAGVLKTNGSFQLGSAAASGIGLYVAISAADHIGQRITAAGSQTANMLELWTGSAVSRFNKAGYFMTKLNAAPADGDLVTGEMALWFDSTAGAAKLMVKAKNASGTVVTGNLALA